VTVTADVPRLDPFGVNQFSRAGQRIVKIFPVFSNAQSRAIFLIVVKKRDDTGLEFSVIGNLDNYFAIDDGDCEVMPKHDGVEILRAIRRNPILGEIQVVVTTNAASPKEVNELREMGVEFRIKPANLTEFERLAADLIAICSGSAVAV